MRICIFVEELTLSFLLTTEETSGNHFHFQITHNSIMG